MTTEDNTTRVLVVEDDKAIMLGLEESLRFAGYEVLAATDGPSGLAKARSEKPDLILLDLMLPGMSGYEVCRELRDDGHTEPIIMLTARQEEFDKLHGFEMGADDYVTKPFSVGVLLARIKAILRRSQGGPQSARTYACDDWAIDLDSRVFTKAGQEEALTRTEFDLLAYFCSNEGKALSREQVMNDVWGAEYYGTQRSLDSFVANLRQKIEPAPHKPRRILTVHGVGYKFSTT